ncbi:hypothetical protein P8452_13287 [Trifolium repens]|nr:hypothetical protein P8452_13287 [Trifolium repens]
MRGRGCDTQCKPPISKKVIIHPIGNRFTPADVATVSIRRVIEMIFPDNISRYGEVKGEERKIRFGMFVSWEPHYEEKKIKTI